jgi:hypothetical protein
MVVVVHNSDIPDGWEREAEDPQYVDVRHFLLVAARTFIEFCLRSKATSCRYSTIGMAAAGQSAVGEQSVLNLLPNTR